jgi:hypothetical protein
MPNADTLDQNCDNWDQNCDTWDQLTNKWGDTTEYRFCPEKTISNVKRMQCVCRVHAVCSGAQPLQRVQVLVRRYSCWPLPYAVVRPAQKVYAAQGTYITLLPTDSPN